MTTQNSAMGDEEVEPAHQAEAKPVDVKLERLFLEAIEATDSIYSDMNIEDFNNSANTDPKGAGEIYKSFLHISAHLQAAVAKARKEENNRYTNLQDETEASHGEPCNFCGQLSHHHTCESALIGVEQMAQRRLQQLKQEKT